LKCPKEGARTQQLSIVGQVDTKPCQAAAAWNCRRPAEGRFPPKQLHTLLFVMGNEIISCGEVFSDKVKDVFSPSQLTKKNLETPVDFKLGLS
jgi:hypothetical protein